MSKVSIQWQNTQNQQESGMIIGKFPFSIGRAIVNDIVLSNGCADVSARHAQLKQVGSSVVLTTLNENEQNQVSQIVAMQELFYIGSYRMTITNLNKRRIPFG